MSSLLVRLASLSSSNGAVVSAVAVCGLAPTSLRCFLGEVLVEPDSLQHRWVVLIKKRFHSKCRVQSNARGHPQSSCRQCEELETITCWFYIALIQKVVSFYLGFSFWLDISIIPAFVLSRQSEKQLVEHKTELPHVPVSSYSITLLCNRAPIYPHPLYNRTKTATIKPSVPTLLAQIFCKR